MQLEYAKLDEYRVSLDMVHMDTTLNRLEASLDEWKPLKNTYMEDKVQGCTNARIGDERSDF